MRLKFDDCETCRFRRQRHVCRECDMGELYEDEDCPGLDVVFREPVLRFGESISADETEVTNFDADRFADGLSDTEEDDDCQD